MIGDELEILFPDITLTLRTPQGEEEVEVREFRFGQAGRVMPIARPLLQEFASLDAEGSELHELQAKHWGAFLQLLALATGKPVEWIEALPDEAGEAISNAFWQVNAPFFARRLVAEAQMLKHEHNLRMSSIASSAPATDATPPPSPAA